MSAIRFSVTVCAALALAACSIGKPVPPPTTYVVDPPIPAPAPSDVRRPETLRIGNVEVAAAFAGPSLVYRVDEVQYVSDPYHAFIAEPAAMLGNRIAEWLDRAGPFATVAQPGGMQATPYVLEATVTELYGDFRPGRPPAAVVAVQFVLLDLRGGRPKATLERTIGMRVDLSKASPDALVRGYGKALADVLTQLVSDLRAGTGK